MARGSWPRGGVRTRLPVVFRKSGAEFTPRSITGLALWLDASDASTLFQDAAATTPATATSDPVGAWLDKSGNARHATQSTAGSRPTISATALNGRKQLALSSASSQSFDANGVAGNLSGDDVPASIIAVVAPTQSANTEMIFSAGNSGNDSPFFVLEKSVSNQLSVRRSDTGAVATVVLGGGTLSGSVVCGLVFSGQSASLLLNGASVASGSLDAASLSLNVARIGSLRRTTSSNFYNGNIAELIVYSKAISVSERQRIERYLAAKWGITLAPQVSNADAQDWINRVYANGGTVSSSTAAAVNQFCDDIDAASLRSKMLRLNLFCGTGLNACLTPLYRAASLGDTQLGNATDTNVGSLFVSGNYSETTGLSTTAGGGQYLNTGLSPNDMALADVQAMHLAASHGPLPSADYDPRPIGAHGPSDRFSFVLTIRASTTGQLGVAMGRTNQVNSASIPSGAQPSASWIGSRTSATSLVIYKNGTADATLATSITGIASHAFPFFVGRINNAGSPLGDSAALPHRHYSIGGALTGAQAASYESALSAFRTALGRTA